MRSANDKRLETVKHHLHDELVDDEGNSPDPEDVDAVVAETAEHLAAAPIQEFVPLLVEHQARDELRRRGLHRELDASEPLGDVPRPFGERTEDQPRLLEWKATAHL